MTLSSCCVALGDAVSAADGTAADVQSSQVILSVWSASPPTYMKADPLGTAGQPAAESGCHAAAGGEALVGYCVVSGLRGVMIRVCSCGNRLALKYTLRLILKPVSVQLEINLLIFQSQLNCP